MSGEAEPTDAPGHRRLAAEMLRVATGGDAALHRTLVRRSDTGSLVVAGALATGEPALAARLGAIDGRAYADFGVPAEAAPAFGAFGILALDELVSPAQRSAWGELGIGHAIAMSFEVDGNLLGTLFSFRAAGGPGFGAGSLAAANRLRGALAARLQRAVALDVQLPPELGPIVFGPEGEVRLAAADVDPRHPAVARLGRQAVAYLRGGAPAFVVDTRAFVELHVVEDGAERLVVATSIPARPMPVHDAMRMTPLRRRIAAAAARGETAGAIALAVGRSEETVRTHLKHIYARLGVGSRVELAEAMRGLWR